MLKYIFEIRKKKNTARETRKRTSGNTSSCLDFLKTHLPVSSVSLSLLSVRVKSVNMFQHVIGEKS